MFYIIENSNGAKVVTQEEYQGDGTDIACVSTDAKSARSIAESFQAMHDIAKTGIDSSTFV